MRLQAVLAASGMHLKLMARRPDSWLPLIIAPILTTSLVLIFLNTNRLNLLGIAVVGPGLLAIIQLGLSQAGEILSTEKVTGTLESTIATGGGLGAVISGRLFMVTIVSLAGLLESIALVALLTGGRVRIYHPVEFGLALSATFVGSFAFILPFVSLLLLARGVRVIQNSITWPLALVSGVIVPVSMLPEPLRIASSFVYLTWCADLLRACFESPEITEFLPRIAAILGLSVLMLIAGIAAFRIVMRRIRVTGNVALP